MRREDALREILSCVFTRLSVEYINEMDTTTDTITIRAKNGYFNDLKFSYASPSFQNTVCSLFWYGFHINNETISCQIVKKRSTKSRAKEYLSSNDIINNSIEYLEKKKIDIKQICKLCSKKVFDDFLLSLIVRRLIPAVFKHRYDQTPDKNDDIDEFLKESYRLMRCDLVDFRFKNYMQSNETELEVVDKRWPKGLCNYKIRFKIHNLPIVPPWENTFIYIPRNLNKLKENKQNIQTEFDKLIEGFIPYSAEDVPPIFSYDDIGFVDDTNPLRFPITQIMVNADAFHIRAFYYITFLDEKTCQSLYPHATTNGALKTVVQEQAIKDLNDEYPQKVASYYTNIFHTIDKVIGNLMTIDLSELVNMHPINRDICENTMHVFLLPREDIFAIVKVYETEPSAILLRIYHSIQIAISHFFTNMDISGLHLALYASRYLDDMELKKHIQLIQDFINSDNLENVVSIQEAEHVVSASNNSAKSKENAFQNYDITEENHRYNQLFIKVKEILCKYLKQLQEPDPALDPFQNKHLDTNEINWGSIPNPFSDI